MSASLTSSSSSCFPSDLAAAQVEDGKFIFCPNYEELAKQSAEHLFKEKHVDSTLKLDSVLLFQRENWETASVFAGLTLHCPRLSG